MADITLHILKPSVNNLTARIFVRAAGLDFEEVDVWGKTRRAEFLAKNPAHLTPMIEERGPAARDALGELRDHAVPLEQARPLAALPDRPGRAGDDRQRDVLPDRHALPAARARDLPGARLPAVPGRGRDLDGRDDAQKSTGAARTPRRRSPSRSRRSTRSSSATGRFIGGDRPSIADIRLAATLEFLHAIDYPLPGWTSDYMAARRVGPRRGVHGAGRRRARLHRVRQEPGGRVGLAVAAARSRGQSVQITSSSSCSSQSAGRPSGVRSSRFQSGSSVPTWRGSCPGSVGA